MVGRDAELASIGRLLGDAREARAGVLLIEGEPGLGKSTLLAAARSAATGFTLVSVQGVETEATLAHAGLLELVTPLRGLVDEIPAPQADALRTALGWASPGTPADPFLVAAATLSLLAAAAESAPVLVTVDDLQWLDRESAAALLFSARRLSRDPVAFVLSARAGSVPAELLHGITALRLSGLAATDVARLLPASAADDVVEQLVARTEGNPLALIEVSARLDTAQWVGAAPLPKTLPVGDRLLQHYEAYLAELSADVWRGMVLLALEQSADTTVVAAALGSAGVDAAGALDEARQHGVLVSDERGLRFRHPLLRTAVLRLATPPQIREAHLALADHLPTASAARSWHRSEGSVGPDDVLADELALVADGERQRLGFAAASASWERAAHRTGDPDRAAEWLAAAAEDAFVAGDLARTRELVNRVLAGAAPRSAQGRALFTLGVLEQYAGSVPRSLQHLAACCDLLTGAALVRARAELAQAAFRLNDVRTLAECADRIGDGADMTDPEQRLLVAFVEGVGLMLRGDPRAAAHFAEVRTLALSDELRHEPRMLLPMALAFGFTGETGPDLRTAFERVDDVRRLGAVGILIPLLAVRAAGRAWVSDHAGAFADAGEAAELADQLGYAADASVAVEMLAWQLASRGLHDDAAQALARAREHLDRAGTSAVAAHHALTAAYCSLCRGDLEEVVAILEARVAADGGLGSMGEPLGVAPLLVEAYAGLGRSEDVTALAARFAEVTPESAAGTTSALVSRCRGLAAGSIDDAGAAYGEAVAQQEAMGDSFEAARSRLLWGSRLRREGQRVLAREQLRRAQAEFARMDLTHWSDRASHELAATGSTARKRDGAANEPLTSQETRVALLVAEGKSNKEIAAALFLSPKTVEHHLASVFRKRGFKRRGELARAFAGPPAD